MMPQKLVCLAYHCPHNHAGNCALIKIYLDGQATCLNYLQTPNPETNQQPSKETP